LYVANEPSKDLYISLFKQTPKVITKEHNIIENIASFLSN